MESENSFTMAQCTIQLSNERTQVILNLGRKKNGEQEKLGFIGHPIYMINS